MTVLPRDIDEAAGQDENDLADVLRMERIDRLIERSDAPGPEVYTMPYPEYERRVLSPGDEGGS